MKSSHIFPLFIVSIIYSPFLFSQVICIDTSLIDPNAVCIEIYDPVCGCDGVTYSNECYAVNFGGVLSWTPGICEDIVVSPCEDLAGVDFGLCDMTMGVGVINGVCTNISGCGWEVNGIDYSPAFYNSIAECTSNCGPCEDLAGVNFGDCDMAMGVGVINGVCTYISGCGWEVNGIDYSSAFYNSIAECNSSCGLPVECIDPTQIDLSVPCPLAFIPVCGCDGVTYDNECYAFNYGGVTSWTQGVCEDVIQPCTDVADVIFGPCLTILGIAVVNGSCSYVSGCSTIIGSVDYSPAFYGTIEECVFECESPDDCIDPTLIDPTASCYDLWDPVCGCNGMTYSNDCYAVNYGGVTSWTQGPCNDVLGGCTYIQALNYQPDASWDDGSCLFAPCNNGCDGDVDGDSSVSVNDILLLLGNFGTICQ